MDTKAQFDAVNEVLLIVVQYSQVSNKQVGWNKRVAWIFFFKFNKQVVKFSAAGL